MKAIKVGTGAGAIAITPNGKTAYVISYYFHRAVYRVSVVPISTATNKAGKAIPLTGGVGGWHAVGRGKIPA